jgi:hypothetical protein
MPPAGVSIAWVMQFLPASILFKEPRSANGLLNFPGNDKVQAPLEFYFSAASTWCHRQHQQQRPRPRSCRCRCRCRCHAKYCTANQSDRALFKSKSNLACVDNAALPRLLDRRISAANGSRRLGTSSHLCASWIVVFISGKIVQSPGREIPRVETTFGHGQTRVVWSKHVPNAALQSPLHRIYLVLCELGTDCWKVPRHGQKRWTRPQVVEGG